MFVHPDMQRVNLPITYKDRPLADNKLSSMLSANLKELVNHMQTLGLYKTVKRGEPPIRPKITGEQYLDTAPQRIRGIIHAMARAKQDGT